MSIKLRNSLQSFNHKSCGSSSGSFEERRRCQNIIIITSELGRNQKSQNVINNALALIYLGHKVRIVTSEIDEDYWEEERSKLFIKKIKSWLPMSLCGFFKNELRILRTLLMAFWITAYSAGKSQPMTVLTDTCALSMMVLKYFGNFNILYFQYFFQLEHIPNIQHHLLSISPTWWQNWAMKYADDVIVQNYASLRLYNNTFKTKHVPKVLHPGVDIGAMEREECLNICKYLPDFRVEIDTYFLITGPYLPRSNFELAIESFDILYNKLQKKGYPNLPLLVIAGKYNDHDESQRMYNSKLIDLINSFSCMNNIILIKKFSTVTKKTLLSHCIAVLHTTLNEIFGNQILEAMYMGRPVIAGDDGVATEYLTQDCGILIKPTPLGFSSAMYNLVKEKVMCEILGLEAKKHFKNNFAFSIYTQLLNTHVEGLLHKKVTFNTSLQGENNICCLRRISKKSVN